ncbi:DoxX family protein [Pseudomonas corrugata]|uniref:DoxX family protein n=1 Tax=Pseudomonas corrugata TaxID=47879 RepID=UPI00222FFE26|nr:DoxX family protein [Pseudomonas corrugata]UZD97713.1 DoxX family protein [Pseudomonas corrugata]
MVNVRLVSFASLILRLTLGGLFLAHAAVKLFVFTPAGTAQFFSSLGLPPTLAYFSIGWEIAEGVALIAGIWTRVAALAGTLTLFGSIVSVHGPAGFFFSNPNGGWEFPGLWIVSLFVLALLGDGALALKPTSFPKTSRNN